MARRETIRTSAGSRVTVALAGDTMLGRGVATVLDQTPPGSLLSPEVVATVRDADLALLNLECCISTRGERWPDPTKPFFFRAPPSAVDALALLGVDCVTLANNHALDFGYAALADTIDLLHQAGIRTVGAGADVEAARRPVVLQAGGFRLGVVAVTDHPAEYAAGPQRPGVAFARLGRGIPDWLAETISGLDVDALLVAPHWGPNMVDAPLPRTRAAAAQLFDAGATVIAGHSAHVFHGVEGPALYDLGDFVDDYATNPVLRNDLGLLFLLTLDYEGPVGLQAVPLKLEYCYTRLAEGHEAAWIGRRFRRACADLGTEVRERAGRLVIDWPRGRSKAPITRRRALRKIRTSPDNSGSDSTQARGASERGGVAMDAKSLMREGVARWNAHDREGFLALYDEAITYVDQTTGQQLVGREAFGTGFYDLWTEMYPDNELKDPIVFAEGELVCFQGRLVGTNTGPFRRGEIEMPPTGKPIDAPFVLIAEVREGKVTRAWHYYDRLLPLEQWGILTMKQLFAQLPVPA